MMEERDYDSLFDNFASDYVQQPEKENTFSDSVMTIDTACVVTSLAAAAEPVRFSATFDLLGESAVAPETMECDSTKRKRRAKMNKHKLGKLRRKNRYKTYK